MFNLGEYRRQATIAYRNHEFFKIDNQEALAIRNKCASEALEDVIRWIEGGGEVAVRRLRFFVSQSKDKASRKVRKIAKNTKKTYFHSILYTN